MLLPVHSPRLPSRFSLTVAPALCEPLDGDFTLLCTRETATGAVLVAGLAQMGTRTIVARTPLDAIHQLQRTDIQFQAIFVSAQDHEFCHREFLTFVEEDFPSLGRVVVATHHTGDETIVWAQPDSVGLQDWRTESGEITERGWRLRFASGSSTLVSTTLI